VLVGSGAPVYAAQGVAAFILCLRQRGDYLMSARWGVMTAGKCWTTRSGRCRVHRVSVPLRNYLMFEGWGRDGWCGGQVRWLGGAMRSGRWRGRRVSAPAKELSDVCGVERFCSFLALRFCWRGEA
jgi:hypothetical protein